VIVLNDGCLVNVGNPDVVIVPGGEEIAVRSALIILLSFSRLPSAKGDGSCPESLFVRLLGRGRS